MGSTTSIADAYEAVRNAKAQLLEAIRAAGPEPVVDWELRDPAGSPVRLSELFGDHDDLLMVHNMGKGCSYCTLWADGFRGIADHLRQRCAFALCSNDPPEVLKDFSAERGWGYPCVSGADTDFAKTMGYADDQGRPLPGVSSFHREPGGSIVRIAHTPFGPGDDFCAVWPLFDLLRDGPDEYRPR